MNLTLEGQALVNKVGQGLLRRAAHDAMFIGHNVFAAAVSDLKISVIEDMRPYQSTIGQS